MAPRLAIIAGPDPREEGAVRTLAFLACVVIVTLFATGGGHAENRVALVVGNDRYPNLPADQQLLVTWQAADAATEAALTAALFGSAGLRAV